MPRIHVETSRSPLYCLSCGSHVSKYAERKFLHDLSVDCSNCKVVTDEFGVGVKVLPTSGQFLKVRPVRDSYWYHSTRVEDWGKRHAGFSDPIYLGTRSAAVRRFKDLSTSATNHKKSGWLYKIKLKPGVKIHRTVVEDDHISPATAEYDDRVVRYVNMFESIGSISLVTQPNHFDIIDVKELP